MAAMICAQLRGATVTALDSRQDRLDFCTRSLDVSQGVSLGDTDEQQLSELSNKEFFDVVFDATGNPKAMERGFRFVAHGGTYVLISVVAASITFSDPEFHKREMTLMGSRNATAEDFNTVLDAMRAGHIPQALNTHRLSLAEVPTKFQNLLDPSAGVIKAIVEC
jgi:threonine dehydrogenase-like Zn-dependent dehydrogenase